MNEIIELENQILKFNNDPQVFALRNRYAQKTFLDIMSVARSENRHSAFLAWLLKGDDFAVSPQDHPIVHLLDSIITRVGENEIDKDKKDKIVNSQNYKIKDYDQLKETILTRDIKSIEIEEIKIEKSLGELCVDSTVRRPLKGLPKLDRIDVYIRFSIVRKTEPRKSLNYEIIIENKIGSSEGGKPTGKYAKPIEGEKIDEVFCEPQTIRYFKACTHNNRAQKPENGSIFVYLTPDLEKDPTSPYFIHITYQDVLDRVIDPLLLPDVNTSDRVRLFLEEYISSLSLPAYEQSDDSEDNTQQIKDAIIMAVRSKEREQLYKLWYGEDNNGYSDLLTRAIKAYNVGDDADRVLKHFCEVNKELIIAILRVAVEANSNDSKLKKAYKDLIRQKHDYSTFRINDAADEFSKGLFFLEIVKRWADAYNNKKVQCNPIDIIKNLKLTGNNDDTIKDQESFGNLTTKKSNAKTNPQKRYYNDSNDIVAVDGSFYYVSNQWGQGGKRFKNWLKYIGITFNKFDNTQNGEIGQLNIDESNADGARVLCDIGIKKITWKRILK